MKHISAAALVFGMIVNLSVAQETITVDLSNKIRPVTHCASGSLYGVTETLPTDIENLVAPLKPNVFANPAISGAGHQQPIGDALKVSERLASTTGKVQVRLADILPGWPYQWPGQQTFLQQCTDIINAKMATGRTNYDGYEIWNEPYGTWNDNNGDYHADLWEPTYDLIRSLDPNERIIGPSFAYYNSSRMNSFLTYCKNNDCLPDVICWHQWGAGGFVSSLENYRQLEKNLGIDPLPISLNEYSSKTNDEYEGCPGYSVPFIAKFERHGVESACISWWHTAYPGRLGSLLTPSNEKGGGWYLYKWYGDMSGDMVSITPPDDKSDGIDGFGCIDDTEYYASICIGGNYTGMVNVDITNIPSTYGSAVNVTTEYVTWTNKDAAVSGTETISSTQYTVTNNAISVPVNVTSNLYAYRVYITPVAILGPPSIEFTEPDGSTGFHVSDSIPIDVDATDEDGTIDHIFFYANDADTTFHEEWLAPYKFFWTPTEAGMYTIIAEAFDNDGNSAKDEIAVSMQGSFESAIPQIPGRIECEHYDKGGNGFAYGDNSDDNTGGGDFRLDEDVDIETCTDTSGGFNIGFATAGEWMEYTVDVTLAGTYTIIVRAACNGDDRTISLSYEDGTPIADAIAIPNTKGWQNWTDVAITDIPLQVGKQVLRITIGESDYVNLNFIDIEPTVIVEPVSIQLHKGWNMVGYPHLESAETADALSSIWDNVITVKNSEVFYSKLQNEQLNLLSRLEWGKGYFVKVTENCKLIW